MGYVTAEELETTLAAAGGAGSRTAAQLGLERLADFAGEAESEVRGRLSAFTLPAGDAAEIPGLLHTITLGIAAYLATLEWYGSRELEDRDPIALRYRRSLDLLRELASGDLVVAGVDPVDSTALSGDAYGINTMPALGIADSFFPESLTRDRFAAPYSGW